MCGIYGIISKKNHAFKHALDAMRTSLVHRGPDGQGDVRHVVGDYQVHLGHVRLAILDLSDDGLQPMRSPCGKYLLSYNGEVYNYIEIKQELLKKGYVFHTGTDSEVVLYALMEWKEDAFNRFNGMWAIAFLDLENGEIVLSRDRFGVKPLYYAQDDHGLYFASEIKAVLTGMNKKFKLNQKIAYDFLAQSSLDHELETFFENLYKVPQASYIRLNLHTAHIIHRDRFKLFWRYPHMPFQGQLSIDDTIEQLDHLFTDAVNIRLRSDVPVGVTLSGGIDSSSIACKMRMLMNGAPINTFSAVSDNKQYDEQLFIDQINQALNSNVHKFNQSLHSKNFLEDYKHIAWINDEPILSFSSVAFYHLMRLANQHGVKVILSGQGADELLCGYKKYVYFYLQSLLRGQQPFKFAQVLAGFLNNGTLIPEFNYHDAKRYLPGWLKGQNRSCFGPQFAEYQSSSLNLRGSSIFERQTRDVQSTSVPALLRYEDRLSMASAVEVRLPFLDYRLVEFCLQLPTNVKLNKGWSKWIFRKSMDKYVPKNVIWRKDKQGFVSPQQQWFKQDFRHDILALFNAPMLSEQLGFIDKQILISNFEAYCNNDKSISYKEVYNPFAFEIWLQKFSAFIEQK